MVSLEGVRADAQSWHRASGDLPPTQPRPRIAAANSMLCCPRITVAYDARTARSTLRNQAEPLAVEWSNAPGRRYRTGRPRDHIPTSRVATMRIGHPGKTLTEARRVGPLGGEG